MTMPANGLTTPKVSSPASSRENEQASTSSTPMFTTPALSALPDQAKAVVSPNRHSPGRVGTSKEQATDPSAPITGTPAPSGSGEPPQRPTLTLVPNGDGHRDMGPYTLEVKSLAETLTDIERVRTAAQNRHRSIVQAGEEGTVAEQQAAKLAELLDAVEHEAILAVQRAVRKHPLGPFVKRTVGIGEKQGARLIAAIEDPWWNTLHDRPRTVSELWAYCGFHVLHPGHGSCDTHSPAAGVDSSAVTGQPGTVAHDAAARDGDPSCSPPGHQELDPQPVSAGVAARRTKGQRANWSNDAKMRARLCAEKCVGHDGKPDKNGKPRPLSPYRAIYDAGRAKYAGSVHAAECSQCGLCSTCGKPPGANKATHAETGCTQRKVAPAPAGSMLRDGHKHSRALRLVAKALLKDLWREARDWHAAEVAG